MGLYLVIINMLTFLLFAIDKVKAKMDAWRISERILMLFVVAGGSVGALIAMIVCRHKIRVTKFRYGVPVLLVIHVVFLCCIS